MMIADGLDTAGPLFDAYNFRLYNPMQLLNTFAFKGWEFLVLRLVDVLPLFWLYA